MNLDELVREAIENSYTVDPDTLADVVVRAVPPDDLRAALRQSLRSYVVRVLALERARHVVPAGSSMSGRVRPGPSPTGTASRKRELAAEFERSRMREAIHTRDGFKHLAECDADDLWYAARVRYDHAARTLDRAREYEKFAKAIEEYRVPRFRDLPARVLGALLEIES